MSAHRVRFGDQAAADLLVGLLLQAEMSLDLVIARRRKRVLERRGVITPSRQVVPRQRHRLDRRERRIEIQEREAS